MKTPLAPRPHAEGRTSARAFTLIELLVVIALIAILAALSLMAMGGVNRKAAEDKTRVEVAAIVNALEQYKSVHEEYPSTLDASQTNAESILPFLGSAKLSTNDMGQLLDAFGNLYEYTNNTLTNSSTNTARHNPASFDLWSKGRDSSIANTDDDIGNW